MALLRPISALLQAVSGGLEERNCQERLNPEPRTIHLRDAELRASLDLDVRRFNSAPLAIRSQDPQAA